MSAPILAFLSPSKRHTIYSDAYKIGLSYILMQNGHVMTYASRQLKPFDVNYQTHDVELA